jgi:hypothetical protein
MPTLDTKQSVTSLIHHVYLVFTYAVFCPWNTLFSPMLGWGSLLCIRITPLAPLACGTHHPELQVLEGTDKACRPLCQGPIIAP